MRTTINIDDDVLEILKSYAEARSVGLGKAASELVRRGLNAPVETRMVNGFCTVVLPRQSSAITTEGVQQLLEDEVE
jgi:hypothetical protein